MMSAGTEGRKADSTALPSIRTLVPAQRAQGRAGQG